VVRVRIGEPFTHDLFVTYSQPSIEGAAPLAAEALVGRLHPRCAFRELRTNPSLRA
jgi:hypothetical protein